jgi:hypothetical protein
MALPEGFLNIAQFNDDPRTEHADVLKVLEHAKRALEQEAWAPKKN